MQIQRKTREKYRKILMQILFSQKIKQLNDSKLFFGLDNLELFLSEYTGIQDDFGNYIQFDGIDQDNTPTYNLSMQGIAMTVTLTNPKGFKFGYQFICSVDGKAVPLFMVRFPQKEESKKSIVLYSAFFVLKDHFEINLVDFIDYYFDVSHMRRYDIAFDTTIKIQKLFKDYFSDERIFTSEIGKDKKNPGFHQTYYIGEIQSDKNRKYLIRIYDKVLDTFKKNKGFLYSHIRENSDIRRIELEVRPHEAERAEFTWRQLLKYDKVAEQCFAKYLNKHWDIELFENISLKPYKYEPFDLKTYYEENNFIPQDYQARVRGYFKKVVENTGYTGLAQIMSTADYDKAGKITQMRHQEALQFLDEYIHFLRKSGTNKSLIKKILKSHL